MKKLRMLFEEQMGPLISIQQVLSPAVAAPESGVDRKGDSRR
jgi:hypothetical protein